jgi:hypothetical protein
MGMEDEEDDSPEGGPSGLEAGLSEFSCEGARREAVATAPHFALTCTRVKGLGSEM